MARHRTNTLIDNRYLLTENLSFDSLSGRQVWAALDKHTGKKLIGRFEPNGRVEWFDDKRPTSAPKPAKLPLGNKIPAPPKIPLSRSKPKLRPFLPVLIFIGALLIAVAYTRKDRIEAYFLAKKQMWQQPEEEESVAAQDQNMPLSAERRVETMEESDLELERQAGAKLEWLDVAISLDHLSGEDPGSHKELFVKVINSFTTLRQNGSEAAVIDSLYKIYMGRAAKSFQKFRQNGDAGSKSYAINWYYVAYSLKPTVELQERIDRIVDSNVQPGKASTKPRGEKTSKRVKFEEDPELKKKL